MSLAFVATLYWKESAPDPYRVKFGLLCVVIIFIGLFDKICETMNFSKTLVSVFGLTFVTIVFQYGKSINGIEVFIVIITYFFAFTIGVLTMKK